MILLDDRHKISISNKRLVKEGLKKARRAGETSRIISSKGP